MRVSNQAPRKGRTASSFLAASALVAALAGCGGGGGSDGFSDEAVGPHAGSLLITVSDELGQPVERAVVEMSYGSHGYTQRYSDAQGKVNFPQVTSGPVTLSTAFDDEFGKHTASVQVMLPDDGHLDVPLDMQPSGIAFGTAASIVTDVATDGHSLEFTLRVFYEATVGLDFDSPPFHMMIADCTPDASNDVPVHQTDCVRGDPNFDAAYEVVSELDPPVTWLPGGAQTPFSAAVLVDQSSHVIVNDTDDQRLFGAKYFLAKKGNANHVAAAAFSADDSGSGELSLLPNSPTTIFPDANPSFTTSGNQLFSTIDSFATLEGGSAPLYAALGSLVDFVSTSPTATGRRAIVAVTAGPDDTCGSAQQCADAVQTLIAKSRAAAVAIVTVGLADPLAQPNGRALAELTEASGGAALWADDPTQVGLLLGVVGGLIDGSAVAQSAHFRIESSTAGAFAPGHTVLGTLHYQICSWGCADYALPFAVRIP